MKTKAKRKDLLHNKITKQQKWIENCEGNSRSYTGPNGSDIRQADNDRLISMKREYQDS